MSVGLLALASDISEQREHMSDVLGGTVGVCIGAELERQVFTVHFHGGFESRGVDDAVRQAFAEEALHQRESADYQYGCHLVHRLSEIRPEQVVELLFADIRSDAIVIVAVRDLRIPHAA